MTCLSPLEVELIDRTAVRGCIAHTHLGLQQGHLIEVGADALAIVAIARDLGDAVREATQRTDSEGRHTTVRRQDHRQACDLLRGIVRTLRMHTHHPIRQMHCGEGGHKEMANIPHVGVYIVDRVKAL